MEIYEPDLPYERHRVYAPAFHKDVSKEEVLKYLLKFIMDENMHIVDSTNHNDDDDTMLMYDLFLCTPHEDMVVRFGNYLLRSVRNTVSAEEFSKIFANSIVRLYVLNSDKIKVLVNSYIEIQKQYPPQDYYNTFKKLNEECRDYIISSFEIKKDLFLSFPKIKTYIAFS